MPFPLGHTAIGLATYETARKEGVCSSRTALFVYIIILANLPDLDMLFGLLVEGNGAAFHRGPTHSLLFALLAGYLASKAGRYWRRIPQLDFGLCALLIFSHVIADMVLTASPVSLLWPFEAHWSQGHSGWSDIIHMALFQGIQDFVIATVVMGYLFILRKVRRGACLTNALFCLARKRAR